jgi:hypothetical protein
MEMKRCIMLLLALCLVLPVYAGEAKESKKEKKKREDKVWLGVSLKTVSGGMKILSMMLESPSQKAGMQIGDVIMELGGMKTASFDQLHAALRGKKAGEEIDAVVLRDGERTTLKLKLEKRGKQDAVSLAKKAAPDMKKHTTAHYVICTNLPASFVKTAKKKMERMYKMYCDFYEIKPVLKKKLVILAFKEFEQYKKYSGMSIGMRYHARMDRGSCGFYDYEREGTPVVSRGIYPPGYSGTLGNMGHEGNHQFFWNFVMSKIPLAQIWIDERRVRPLPDRERLAVQKAVPQVPQGNKQPQDKRQKRNGL